MHTMLKTFFAGAFSAACFCVNAAGPTPPPGTTTCRWVGDDKVCTTYRLAKKTYDDGHLRPEEVKQCLLDKRRIASSGVQFNTEKSAYNAEGAAINAESASVQKSADELLADGNKLTTMRTEIEQLAKEAQETGSNAGQASHFSTNTPAKKIAAYNQHVAEYTTEQKDYNAKIAAYNATVTAQKDRIAKHAAIESAFNDREKSLKEFSDSVHKRCVEGRQVYEDDLNAAVAAIARDDVTDKK
jgi:chromosome segregation ATPase